MDDKQTTKNRELDHSHIAIQVRPAHVDICAVTDPADHAKVMQGAGYSPYQYVPTRVALAANDLLAAAKQMVANLDEWLVNPEHTATAEQSKHLYESLVNAIAKAEGRAK